MKDGLLFATNPFDGDTRPILFGDGTAIVLVAIPTNAVANLEEPRLVARHQLSPGVN